MQHFRRDLRGIRATGKDVWAIQFHPEVWHSTEGPLLLKNFVMGICGCTGAWTPDNFVEATVADLQAKIGPEDRVILGLSGGVDSTVAAELLNRAIGDRLHCIFVDNGLLRKNEFEQVLEDYNDMGLNVRGVRAGDQFLEAWPARPTLKPSARPLAVCSLRCSTRRRTKWKAPGGWGREPFTLT